MQTRLICSLGIFGSYIKHFSLTRYMISLTVYSIHLLKASTIYPTLTQSCLSIEHKNTIVLLETWMNGTLSYRVFDYSEGFD